MSPQPEPLRWRFHGLTLEGRAADPGLRARWRAAFASRPLTAAAPDLVCTLDVVAAVPEPPARPPQFRQAELIEYYLDGDFALAHFPRFGQLRLDLKAGVTVGALVQAALDTYGVLEDLTAIALSPHLRRRGLFLIHAFAAVEPRAARAALLVGGIGAGKTTTGLALLAAGWKLLSNDSPILRTSGAGVEVLSYPGLLAAYPDSFARFPATAHLAEAGRAGQGRPKITAPAEAVWPGVWAERAGCAAILFPQIEARAEHAVEPLSPPEALRRLLPHAVEQWDKAMLPAHLGLLGDLVRAAPAFQLRLGPDVSALPELFERCLEQG
jgi:hypothetical protein